MIRVGVAGWDYADWEGLVYPSRPGRGFDRLAYLAGFVDVLEINSSFYRPPEPALAASWEKRTRARATFAFTAKAHRSLTHELESEPREAAAPTLAGLEPLRAAGRLGALLVQFPHSFHRIEETLVRLERIVEALHGWPVVVEVRHVSWDTDEAEVWMRDRGVGFCVVDQPRVGRSTARARPRTTSRVGYLRFHGRNARDWFREDAGRDARYDYLYSQAELEPLANATAEVARTAEEVFVVQNNHFRGQAVVNALQMKHLLTGSHPAAPESLVAAYPVLRDLVTVIGKGQRHLF